MLCIRFCPFFPNFSALYLILIFKKKSFYLLWAITHLEDWPRPRWTRIHWRVTQPLVSKREQQTCLKYIEVRAKLHKLKKNKHGFHCPDTCLAQSLHRSHLNKGCTHPFKMKILSNLRSQMDLCTSYGKNFGISKLTRLHFKRASVYILPSFKWDLCSDLVKIG